MDALDLSNLAERKKKSLFADAVPTAHA